MIEYWKINWSTMLIDLQQHAVMVLASLGIALVIAGAMILLLMHRKKLVEWVNLLFFVALFSSQFCLFCPLIAYFRFRNAHGNYCLNNLL